MTIYTYLTLALPVVMMIAVVIAVHFIPLDTPKGPRR
ncbi:hypothetical protein C7477_10163 [Phyllobacterium leguminum]|uniref:Uncharacterized protein n=1 Tax=Phyllobacterium leguminum TaxID=314237 RepID=A0A318T725_9HYPH|nr:hypothetical protein C7477_10163 [Phyllobacterium leguminum]